jgi:CDP-paratose 2-epimerase
MRSTNNRLSLRRPEPPHRVNGSGETLIGVVESFRPGERQHVEDILADLRELDITELRTTISCTDYHSPGRLEWFSWLIPHLARQVNVLPCLVNGPWVGATANRSGPNVTATSAYPAFVEDFIRRFGSHFDHVQFTGEPAQWGQSDWADDLDWKAFAGMIREAAWLAHQHGKKTVLAGMSPLNTSWLRLMFRYGAMDQIDVVGVQGFPGVWEANWQGWRPFIERVQIVLDDHDSPARIWITETGYSTASHNLFRQVQAFLAAI